jgi:hypothetical protein
MKHVSTYFKILLLFFAVLFYSKINAQVNGFQVTESSFPATHNLGTNFSVNVAFNWTSSTSSATAVINYDNTLVSFNSNCQGALLPCMNLTYTNSAVIITLTNLNNCNGASSVSFDLCFAFKCPDSCTGVNKTAVFNGDLTDNLGTHQNDGATAIGMLENNATMTNSFYSFNQLTGEVTYQACVNNLGCFKIRNPIFHVALSPALGTITSAYGAGYTYSVSGTNITAGSSLNTSSACFFYVVKLPCNTGLGQVLSSTVSLTGTNCTTANSLIATSPAASFPIPSSTVGNTSISLNPPGVSATSFSQYIYNNGNTPVNLTITNYLPSVHLTSVSQSSSQAGLAGTVKYFDCSSVPGTTYSLSGNTTNSGVPTQTKKFEHRIINLMPNSSVTVSAGYTAGTSCNGNVAPPFRDSLVIAYDCTEAQNDCGTCGPDGTKTQVIVYSLKPQISCFSTNNIPGCKKIGDTIEVCYRFTNIGTDTLKAGVLNVTLPTGLQYVAGSAAYTDFTGTPSVIVPSNVRFNLPNILVGDTVKVCLKAVLQAGIVSGTTNFYTYISGSNLPNTYMCYASFVVCTYSAIGVSKRVNGSLDGTTYSLVGQGAPNTPVNFEITLRNIGTVPVNHLEVIDRIPANGNRTILTPSSVIPNAFNMTMMTAPTSPDYSVTYTGIQNICTGWPGTGTPCNSGAWGTVLANGGVRFTFTPAFEIPAGGTYVFTFQAKIPSGVAGNLTDSNRVGFVATPATGGILNAVESAPVAIKTVNPCNTVTPLFTINRTCSSGVNVVTVSSPETTANHEWFLMQTNPCGVTTDAATVGQIGATQTGASATFNITNSSICYYIKHHISVPGCYDTTIRMAFTLPQLINSFHFQDEKGKERSEFCLGEAIYFDGSASSGESQYSISISRRLAGTLSSFTPYVNLGTFSGQAGVINLSQALLNLVPPRYFTSQYEYSLTFAVSNPGECVGTMTTKKIFRVLCCDDFFNADFQLGVTPASGSYTMTSALVQLYPYANPTYEWYVLSSPNPSGGPYTPVTSSTGANFTFAGAQYNLFYTVIHKIRTTCGEVCSSVVQYQSQGKSVVKPSAECCLAFQFWPNGAGSEPQPFTAEFDMNLLSLGGGQYTIDILPTYSYSNNPSVTHEWYVLSSPNASGGPFTAVAQGSGFNYDFSPASDGLYYFIIHKVKSPCGDICYGQNICRNCKATKCELCGVIDCKLLDEIWPDCYPPINLVSSCRRGTLSWGVVPAAGGYELDLSYNDPECCKSEYLPSERIISLSTNSFNLNEIRNPKFTCIRWRVRAKCKEGFSEWSSWSCYSCELIINPFPITIGRNTDIAAEAGPLPDIYPNPNKGDMYLQMKAKGELVLSVEVFNNQGVLVKTIKESKYPDGNFGTRLSMGSNMPKGLYLVVFRTNFGTYNKKVIIN